MPTTITKQMRTETGHRLHPYDGKCSHLHGHSYLWEVTVVGDGVDPSTGMVLDFKEVKKAMESVIEPLDHAFLFCHADPLIDALGGPDGLMRTLVATNGQRPRIFILPFNPTAEYLAAWAAEQLNEHLPDSFMVDRIKLWETATSFAEWTPPSYSDAVRETQAYAEAVRRGAA